MKKNVEFFTKADQQGAHQGQPVIIFVEKKYKETTAPNAKVLNNMVFENFDVGISYKKPLDS